MKKLITMTLIASLILMSPAKHFAQILFPTIVFDPSVDASIGALNAATTANQIQQILNQIEQIKTAVDTFLKLKETYDKIKETYDLAKKMSQYLTGPGCLCYGSWPVARPWRLKGSFWSDRWDSTRHGRITDSPARQELWG